MTGSIIDIQALVASERFQSKIDKTGDCWVWTGALSAGYGVVGLGERGAGTGRAARLYYMAFHGQVLPDHLHVDHLCRNRACVRPSHCEAVTNKINTQRGAQSNSLTGMCRKGLHPWEGDNIVLKGNGDRTCRQCKRDRERGRYAGIKG
jgi:hypothetical protein